MFTCSTLAFCNATEMTSAWLIFAEFPGQLAADVDADSLSGLKPSRSPTAHAFFSGSAVGGERGRKPQDIRHVQEAKPVLEALSLNNLPVPRPLPPRLFDHIPLEPPCASAPFHQTSH
ncbi:uncharacterized protein LOC113508428 [Trichoplusia ni]|uniref:Uncharacterized protein LOC113506173 n=1 Tax=Trichoplusia ni TaxID=7111 RepID=A0A7E5X4D4_TRINI|nr:uncharacterized protein LOC113506173 [Trichoplusia ni]XP_026747271.1 uncharacterized protein LOC113508428 [Trichoplusia ni]